MLQIKANIDYKIIIIIILGIGIFAIIGGNYLGFISSINKKDIEKIEKYEKEIELLKESNKKNEKELNKIKKDRKKLLREMAKLKKERDVIVQKLNEKNEEYENITNHNNYSNSVSDFFTE